MTQNGSLYTNVVGEHRYIDVFFDIGWLPTTKVAGHSNIF